MTRGSWRAGDMGGMAPAPAPVWALEQVDVAAERPAPAKVVSRASVVALSGILLGFSVVGGGVEVEMLLSSPGDSRRGRRLRRWFRGLRLWR